jgi:hypothetical protein
VRNIKVSTGLPLAFAALTVMGGDLDDRYRLSLERVQTGVSPRYDEELILADVQPRHVRRFTEYSGDVSGRYLSALAFAGVDTSTITRKIIALQKPDGHFGEPLNQGPVGDHEMAILWGNGRLLVGLMETYQAHPSMETLNSARKLGDWLVSLAPLMNSDAVKGAFRDGKFAVGYICWTQNTEGLALLYSATKDGKYLKTADSIAVAFERRPGQHSHGYLTTLRGILDLYSATGERKYLEQAEREWLGLVQSGNVMPHGAIPEMLIPEAYRDEGCSQGDWLRLNLGLWRETGKTQYLERAEHALFNEFSLNQFSTGDYGHRPFSPRGVGVAATKSGASARAWWCCSLHGLRTFPDIRAAAFREAGEILYYDLPVDARKKIGGFSVNSTSRLNTDGSVQLTVLESDGKIHALAPRQPKWATAVTIQLNGRPADAAELRRIWKTGDSVTLQYRMITTMVPAEQFGGQKGLVMFTHGPWILAVDEASSPAFFDEPSDLNRLLAGDPGKLLLKPAPEAGPANFGVPVARFRVAYKPGGYSIQEAAAVLRALGEQTGGETTSWEMQFRVK